MAETTHDTPPPVPLPCLHDGAIAVRSPDEPGDHGSGCFVLGHTFTLQLRDVRTGQPIRSGGYLKSVKITLDGKTDAYVCKDADRYPPAARTVDLYDGYSSKVDAQRARFYRWVSSSLKRLGFFTGAISGSYTNALGTAMKKLYERQTQQTVANLNDVLEDFHVQLQKALAGRDEVDAAGFIRMGLPEVATRKTCKVKVEFHDVKFLTQQDVIEAAEAVRGRCEASTKQSITPNTLTDNAIVYDRAAALWPTGGADPDQAENESTQPKSNWCLQVKSFDGKPHKVKFRNFFEFEIPLDPDRPVDVRETVHVLTWCQPVWHEEFSFRREGLYLNTFKGPPARSANTSINSLHPGNGQSSYNYAVFGLFRSASNAGKSYFRLHTGIDLMGRHREQGGNLRTPVFAVNGGRATQFGSNIRLNHRDAQVTRYVHMYSGDLLVASKQWVKAGTLLGKMGRNAIPDNYPTHCHFETLLADSTGWKKDDFTELADGAAKVAAYPRKPEVDTCTEDPKYIKFQYGTWTRDPGHMLKQWIDEQLGGDAFDAHFSRVMPASWPSNHTPPCRNEFGPNHLNNPMKCIAACKGAGDEPVATQVLWAKTCWAIRNSNNPAQCSCPGLSANGLAKSFTKAQRIQYHLWQLGHYQAEFDGQLGGSAVTAIFNGLPDIGEKHRAKTGAASAFARDVNTETEKVVADQAKKKKVEPDTIKQTPEHRKMAIKNLLAKSDKLDLLLAELQRIAPFS